MIKIAIINDVHVGKPLLRNNLMRAASHLAEDKLPHILQFIHKKHAPDLIVNMGDLIRSENAEADKRNYEKALGSFKSLDSKTLHLIGNHEIRFMTLSDVESVWEKSGIHQKSFGLLDLQYCALIWLGLAHDLSKNLYLPEEQLLFLEKTLEEVNKPTFILTHCALDDQEVSGNFFYEGFTVKDKTGFFLTNQKDIQKIIGRSPQVKLVLQAHLHYFHTKVIQNIPYVTCPAMADNICGPYNFEHIPEIYSLLTVEENHFTLKSYSKDYCFAGMEFP